MTYTVVVMEVSPSAWKEIHDKLVAAGYQHAIDSNGMLDMTHIGLMREEPPEVNSFSVSVDDPSTRIVNLGAGDGV